MCVCVCTFCVFVRERERDSRTSTAKGLGPSYAAAPHSIMNSIIYFTFIKLSAKPGNQYCET